MCTKAEHNRKMMSQEDVDRTGEFNPDPEIIVTLEDGFKQRFWITGLSDYEYLNRAKHIREFCT